MAIFSDLIQQAMGGFPTIPKAPNAPYVDPQAAQSRTAAGNLSELPTLEQIASGVDTFNLSQRNKALTSAIPGYTNLVADASGTLGSWLQGQIPADVAGQVGRTDAAKAIAGGYGGSPLANNLTLRDLGLTSLDMQRMGEQALPGFLGHVTGLAVPQPFDVTSGMLTPGQDLSAEQWNAMNQFSQQWLQNRLSSLPDPATAAISKDVGGIGDLAGTALLSWAGGGIGGLAGMGTAGSMLGAQVGGAGPQQGAMFGSIFGGG